MKLKDYLKEYGIVHAFFAKKIGTSSPQLSLWLSGRVKPRLEFIAAMEEATKGKVTFRDWIIEKSDPIPKSLEVQQQ